VYKDPNNLAAARAAPRSHQRSIANAAKIAEEEKQYNKNPTCFCTECKIVLPFASKRNKFCSNSCGGKFINRTRDKECYCRSAKTLKATLSKKPKIKKVYSDRVCQICTKTFNSGKNQKVKTCSTVCKNNLISKSTRGKTGGSTKQFIEYCDSYGNKCSLDSSWELIVAQELDKNHIIWTRPRSFLLSNGRRYTPDFFLVDYLIYLDPKAYRKGYLTTIKKIKKFENEYATRCLVISDKKLLTWEHIKSLL